ncbi:glycine-rich protein [Zea mays]|uniref:Glycine-rich protein n=1 Tax=Zea mays TaxID=4577 RepID=A0A1D6PE41_MAIZE|nr:glycine-rich protein [Zea mays]
MVLVRSGMVDLVVVGGAHMAVEEVEDSAAEVEVVHGVLALYLTSNPMTTVLSLLVDPAVANKRATVPPDDYV